MKLPLSWSEFPREKEVLLWPNFAFKYVTSRKEKWYNYVVLEQDESFEMFSEDEGRMKQWWVKFISEQIKPFCDFFKKLRYKIKDAIDFMAFFQDNYINLLQRIEDQWFKTNSSIFKEVEESFIQSIKNKLFFGIDRQQNQVNLYQLLIRDMKIVKILKNVWNPYFGEIVSIIRSKKSKEVIKEIFVQNIDFFSDMRRDLMDHVNEILEVYLAECTNICCNLFEN